MFVSAQNVEPGVVAHQDIWGETCWDQDETT